MAVGQATCCGSHLIPYEWRPTRTLYFEHHVSMGHHSLLRSFLVYKDIFHFFFVLVERTQFEHVEFEMPLRDPMDLINETVEMDSPGTNLSLSDISRLTRGEKLTQEITRECPFTAGQLSV